MDIFKSCFEKLTSDDRILMNQYFHGYDYKVASYTFMANYIWRNTYCLCWEIKDDYLYMAGTDCMTRDPQAIISMPLTKTGTYDIDMLRKGVLEAKEKFDSRGLPFSIEVIPESLVPVLEEAFPGQLKFDSSRDDEEYVYLKDKLINLSGRALHKKKNHMNYFKKNFVYEARPLTLDDEEALVCLVRDLMTLREEASPQAEVDEEMESLRVEEDAISEAIKMVELEDVYSMGIFIDGSLVAFSIGERLNKDTAVAHFEKAVDSYRGLYQVVASEFCKALPEDIVYVNREEDMGIENLRKAKEALRPDHMVKKYSAQFL